MISNELAEKILDYAMTRGGDYAEIFEEEREYTKIGIAGKETPTILAGQEAGLGVRILKGTKSCYLTFSHPEEGVLFRKMKGALSDWNDRAHIRTFSGKDSFPKRQQVFRTNVSRRTSHQETVGILRGIVHAGEEEAYVPVREKHFSVKPATVEEAILEMNLLGHEFFLFRSADTDEVQAVYRRHNGTYGLLVPER